MNDDGVSARPVSGMMVLMVTVADCQRVQTNWFRARADELGGTVWIDDGLLWTDGSDGMNVIFPSALTTAAVRRGVDRARDLGRDIIGAWLSTDVDPTPLARAGFDRGWSPWWMTAELSVVPQKRDLRVRLEQGSTDWMGDHAAYGDLLALTRREPATAWYAAAHTHRTGRFAGHAWSFLDGDLAGILTWKCGRDSDAAGWALHCSRPCARPPGRRGRHRPFSMPPRKGNVSTALAASPKSVKVSPGGTTWTPRDENTSYRDARPAE